MVNNNKPGAYKVFNLLAFVGMVVVNALSSMLPINGTTPGAVSDSYPNLFAPSGLTFSIWGVIYLLLAAFILYQFGIFKGKSGYSIDTVKNVSVFFIISSLANIAWIFSWHYRIIPLSMVLMVIILLCLIRINSVTYKAQLSKKDKFFLRLPFGIYFGWITVATIANATTLLVSIGWNGFGIAEPVWMIVALAAGLIIGIWTTLKYRHFVYGLVFLWAYLGILLKHLEVFSSQYTQIIIATIVSMVLIVVAVVIAICKSCSQKSA